MVKNYKNRPRNARVIVENKVVPFFMKPVYIIVLVLLQDTLLSRFIVIIVRARIYYCFFDPNRLPGACN